jgi:hypothetical protein
MAVGFSSVPNLECRRRLSWPAGLVLTAEAVLAETNRQSKRCARQRDGFPAASRC